MGIKVLIVALIFYSIDTNAQELVVLKAKKSNLINGVTLKPYDTISVKSKVKVKKNGKLTLKTRTGWNIWLKEGAYDLDSTFSANKFKHVKNDSIYRIMEELGIVNCDFSYEFVCAPTLLGNRTSVVGMIEFDKDYYGTIIESDSITLRWKDSSNKEQKYYLVVYDLFDELIGIHRTKAYSITLNLVDYRNEMEGIIIYKIVSDECKETEKKALELK